MNCSSSAAWPLPSAVGSSHIVMANSKVSPMQTRTGSMTARKRRQNRTEVSMSRELIPQSSAAFLNLRHLPARLDLEQAAALLGHHPDHIPILVEGKLLKPLGNPPKNGIKWFSCSDVL